jgi:hypothetical protein
MMGSKGESPLMFWRMGVFREQGLGNRDQEPAMGKLTPDL